MSNLREELKKYKERKDELTTEAAISWVEKNIVLINEKLNRNAINKLTNSIVRFDEKFGEVKEKLPALQDVLDKAELGLQLVLTGKVSDTRASDMLQRLSFVYAMLSNFFSADLPVLLRTPLFSNSKEDPDKRLDSITGPKHNIKDIISSFEVALRPSKEELKLFNKIYRGIPMPNIRSTEVAAQLAGLSYNELADLTKAEKVPMVAIEKPEATTSPEDSFQSLSEEVLNEQGVDKMTAVITALGQLDDILKTVGGLPGVQQAVTNLRQKAQSTFADQGILANLRAAFKKGDMSNVVKTTPGQILAQAEMAINTFQKLGEVWPKVEQLFTKENFTQADADNLENIILNQLKGGMFQRLTSLFKGVKPETGLSPESMASAVKALAMRKVSEDQTAQNSVSSSTKTTGTSQVMNPVIKESAASSLKEDFSELAKMLQALNQKFKPQPAALAAQPASKPGVATAKENPATTTAAASPGIQTQGTTPTVSAPSAEPQKTSDGFIEVGPDASDEQLKAITKKTGVEEDRLKRLTQVRGIRLQVAPGFFQVK